MKPLLRVFVYGTLKKGFHNHDRYCAGVLRIEPARLRGRLFRLSPRVPVMTVPEEDILVRGSADIDADMEAQERFASHPAGGPGASSGVTFVRGELLTFDDPAERLPVLDRFEGFRPGRKSTYVRALVVATVEGGPATSAWAYVAGFDTAGLEEYPGESWDPGAHRARASRRVRTGGVTS